MALIMGLEILMLYWAAAVFAAIIYTLKLTKLSEKDKELRVCILSSLLVAGVFVIAVANIQLYPEQHMVIYEVFQVVDYGDITFIHPIAQDRVMFLGSHGDKFEVGKSYRIVYKYPSAIESFFIGEVRENRYLHLISVTELPPFPKTG